MIKLPREKITEIQYLFAGLDHSLAIQALFAGYNPGAVYVDDIKQPHVAFALTVEGYFLVGDPSNAAAASTLHTFLMDEIMTSKTYLVDEDHMSLGIFPGAWEFKLPEIIPTHAISPFDCYHYLCTEVQVDWQEHLPEGYRIERIDRSMFDQDRLPEEFLDLISADDSWGSLEHYLKHGGGYVIFTGDEAAACCSIDCTTGDRIEVGVYTMPDHRRKGLAVAAVAAVVEDFFNKGGQEAGWQCVASNEASWRIAEKVGFKRAKTYTAYYYIFDKVDHLAELGWQAFQRGELEVTRTCYEQVFAQREENPDYYYHLAAVAWGDVKDTEKTLDYLRRAAERGWRAYEWTGEHEVFRFLHGTHAWEEVLAMMKRNEEKSL
jgi:RimJ/RimL family protein N-acetyltransferase